MSNEKKKGSTGTRPIQGEGRGIKIYRDTAPDGSGGETKEKPHKHRIDRSYGDVSEHTIIEQ